MQIEKKAALMRHIEHCEKCAGANRRVNDFCDLGRVFFNQWAIEKWPASATLLGEEESARIIAAEAARAERRRWN